MQNATGDGKTSIMPWTLEALYVYYRPSYFKKAGITSTPTTFAEWLDDIRKCTMDTNGDGKTDVYGYGMRGAGGGHEHLGSFLYAYGASWDDLTTPQAVEAY
jgi:multiple sugar transport system substrate-binding protein